MPLQIDKLIATSVDAQTITSNGAPVGKNPISSVFIDTTLFTNFLPNGESTLESVFFGDGELPYSIIKLSDGSFLITRLSIAA
jgi:hypothetical protein